MTDQGYITMQNSATTLANAAAATAKKDTSKSKPALSKDLGISLATLEERSIMWVPFVLTTEDARLLKALAESRSTEDDTVKTFVAPSKALAEWLDANREAITEEAKAYLAETEKTTDELAKEEAALLRKLERLQEQLKAKKA